MMIPILKKLLCSILFVLLLSVLTFAQRDIPQYALGEAGYQWNSDAGGIAQILVCWENPQGYGTEIQWVQNAIENSWGSVANINFYGWGQCFVGSRGIRIRVTDERSHSYVGKRLDGVEGGMSLNFTFNNFSQSCQAQNKRATCIKGIAVHEFGHALGLQHEQDRDDSKCFDEQVIGSGFKLTEYDKDSVMNYCNQNWIEGKLSPKDIEGIQRLYGAKTNVPTKINSQVGQVLISDSVVQGQVWENIVVDFGGSRQFFAVNGYANNQVRAWNYPGAGKYCFTVWSFTMFNDGLGRNGYGQGCFDLQAGQRYTGEVAVVSWNPVGKYYNLTIQPKIF